MAKERACELDHTLVGDTGVLNHDASSLFHVRFGDISGLHAGDDFLVSQYTILIGIALLPVFVGGGVEVELGDFHGVFGDKSNGSSNG